MMCDTYVLCFVFVFFFKQKTAYEMRISDWSSDVCSSDLLDPVDRAYIAVAVAHRDIETVRTAFGGHVDPADIGLRREAIGHNPPIADARHDPLHFRMVQAQQRRAIERHVLDKLDIRRLDVIDIAKMV